jgi:hypothetical protein
LVNKQRMTHVWRKNLNPAWVLCRLLILKSERHAFLVTLPLLDITPGELDGLALQKEQVLASPPTANNKENYSQQEFRPLCKHGA